MGKASKAKQLRKELQNDEQSYAARLAFYMNGLIEASRVCNKLVKYEGTHENPMIKTGVKEIAIACQQLADKWQKYYETLR